MVSVLGPHRGTITTLSGKSVNLPSILAVVVTRITSTAGKWYVVDESLCYHYEPKNVYYVTKNLSILGDVVIVHRFMTYTDTRNTKTSVL